MIHIDQSDLPGLRVKFLEILNEARCGLKIVGNIELADRLIDALMLATEIQHPKESYPPETKS